MTIVTNGVSRPCVLLIVFLCASAWGSIGTDVRAQEFGRLEQMQERSNVAYFYHAQPGEATVQVSVWGTVPRPGIYEVSDSTDLDKLMTMAGGAPLEPRPENRERPKIMVRLFRPQEQDRSLLFEAPIEQILSGEKHFSNLQDDDILVVETVQQREFTWRDALSFSSTALSLALLVVRIVDIQN